MINIYVNNIKIQVPKNTTVLQACNTLKIEIPKFCFQENLQIAGNCRMCLVEIENSPKPVASCAMPVMNNMKIFTDTPLVQKARESVLEFLLINHPLDCPICDQASECDLQDQTLIFGTDRSRFFFKKKSVEDKYCGLFIKTIMTQCINFKKEKNLIKFNLYKPCIYQYGIGFNIREIDQEQEPFSTFDYTHMLEGLSTLMSGIVHPFLSHMISIFDLVYSPYNGIFITHQNINIIVRYLLQLKYYLINFNTNIHINVWSQIELQIRFCCQTLTSWLVMSTNSEIKDNVFLPISVEHAVILHDLAEEPVYIPNGYLEFIKSRGFFSKATYEKVQYLKENNSPLLTKTSNFEYREIYESLNYAHQQTDMYLNFYTDQILIVIEMVRSA